MKPELSFHTDHKLSTQELIFSARILIRKDQDRGPQLTPIEHYFRGKLVHAYIDVLLQRRDNPKASLDVLTLLPKMYDGALSHLLLSLTGERPDVLDDIWKVAWSAFGFYFASGHPKNAIKMLKIAFNAKRAARGHQVEMLIHRPSSGGTP
ncbi:MAG: hypothetical protein Q8R11_00185 [bacterium]|nr:hypothetical protein [bacterium]